MTELTLLKEVNGVDVDRLFGTIDAIKETPNLADFKFRARNRWIKGDHNRSTIKEFYGAGGEDSTRVEPFILNAGEAPVLLGRDNAPNPVEYLLHALAACVTTSMVYHAAAKGIEVEEVESRLEGDIDLHGFLGLDETVPKGYKNIRIKFKIKADVPDEVLQELIETGQEFSPVYNSVTRGVPVDVTVERK